MQVCSDVSRLTDAYHQTVLGLTESSNTEVAWDVSQHVLDRLWTSSNPVEDSVSPPSIKLATVSSTFDSTIHACQGCGYGLYPGWRGTSMRVKRPKQPSSLSAKKTVRRREQRKRRRAARTEEMKAKDNHGRRRSSVSSLRPDMSVASTRNDNNAAVNQHLVVLQDDPIIGRLERNRLVLTCGRCQDKTYIKGLRREQQQRTAIRSTPITSRGASGYIKKRAPPFVPVGDANNLAEDFVSLPRYRKKPPKPPPPRVAAALKPSKSSLSLLEQKREQQFGARKQKKKRVTELSSNKKTGNLLNFLSSLNDH